MQILKHKQPYSKLISYGLKHFSKQIDYYKVLDLKPDCTQNEIKKQFYILAKLYHPDV